MSRASCFLWADSYCHFVVFQAPLCHERASEPAKDRRLKLLPDVDSSPFPARRKRATVVSPGSSAAASIRIGINLFLTVRGCLSFLDYRDQRKYKLIADTDYTCTNPGLWPYFFVIQFLVLLKLVLLTLLYALFSHTAQKIESASDDIWKFQRYKLVVDFMNRLCLPPPLNVFSYIIAFLQFLWRLLTCHFCRTTHQLDGHPELAKSQLRLSEKDYNYWKHLASQYSQRKSEEREFEEKKKKQLESLSYFLEDMDHQRHTLSLLKGQIQELQRTVGKSFSYLQTLKNATDRPGEPGGLLPGAVHVLSRKSPYPSTRVLRYPVPDKYVAWQVLWLEYDPVAYSRPRTDFPAHLQPHVDEDILELKLASDGGPVPSFAWNSVSTSPAGVSINRQSWIRDADGLPIIYRLDAQGMPMWQRAKVHLIGGRGLEVVLMRVFRTDHFSLPGKARHIVGHYKHSSSAQKRLDEYQKKMGKDPLRLVQDVDTRWNSQYLMLSRLLELKEAVSVELAASSSSIDGLCSAEWKEALEYLDALKLLYDATVITSADKYQSLSTQI
ncbi:hypothetical protein HPB51_001466 [Rhipicephalus microplus]|uniref:Uncharacterized protein n=1 Tax=Rhipicephalus microplus TaxID=6941 RepID=A0A9J6DS94_RHIMP|nr:hypothetical protein HPB51_001466 [Rhipicephalus microplus]